MPEELNPLAPEKQYDKIGGWLILIAIGLILTPIKILIDVIEYILPAFTGEVWTVLTTPGTELYHPLWAPLLIFSLIGNLFLIGFALTTSVFFFKKKKIVPKLMIIYLAAGLVFFFVDFFGSSLIPIIEEQEDMSPTMDLVRSIVACLIWIPYFRMSKRVKGTFVN
ncbi:MAG: DUF2569 domain-containing protein [Deltaproteobacteria bacterium]|nr:DUF2569 domain-containing protein [Deltaproteobacteria bacterium]